jgi:hypothetical protein
MVIIRVLSYAIFGFSECGVPSMRKGKMKIRIHFFI